MYVEGRKMEKISIVTICLNEEEKIQETLESALKQTYTDIEYVIKDGCSTDNTNETIKIVIEKYGEKNIKHIIQADTGIYDAMNQAIDYCTGDWVIFMNSGDLFATSNILERIFESNKYENYGVLYGDAMVRDDVGDSVWKGNITRIEKGMPFCHQSCLIRREILRKYPFDTKFKIAADYNNILQLYINNIAFYNTNKIISIFRLDGVSSTRFIQRYKEKKRAQSLHGIGDNSKIKYQIGLLGEMIKTIVSKYCPKYLLKQLKVIYIKYFKRYENV